MCNEPNYEGIGLFSVTSDQWKNLLQGPKRRLLTIRPYNVNNMMMMSSCCVYFFKTPDGSIVTYGMTVHVFVRIHCLLFVIVRKVLDNHKNAIASIVAVPVVSRRQ